MERKRRERRPTDARNISAGGAVCPNNNDDAARAGHRAMMVTGERGAEALVIPSRVAITRSRERSVL